MDQTVINGGTATFTVAATSGTTLSYQWYKDGLLNLDLKLTGETSSTLTLRNVGILDEGTYYVEVKNAGGTVTSRHASLNAVYNTPPAANNDSYTTLEDVPVTIAVPGILANDTDANGDTLTAVLVSTVTHGSLSLNPNGSFIYTPNTNYYGSDSFAYAAHDGVVTGNVATVTITITPVNDEPVAVNDSYTTLEDVPLTIPAASVLSNDTDVDGDALTARLVSNVTHGGLSINAKGDFTYTPDSNYNGSDSFTYAAHDGAVTGNVATVTITITPVNDAPIANSDSFTLPKHTPLTISAAGVLKNDTDVENDALTASLVSNVTHGSLSFNSDGSFTYTPTSNYAGSDSFTYYAWDGYATSAVTTVSLTIVNTNTLFSIDSGVMTGAGFELKLSGPTVASYVIEASTNLTDWIPISTNSGFTGDVVFTDTEAPKLSQRFYRAVSR